MSEEALASLIAVAEAAMEPALARFWQRIKVRPEKWQLPPWGNMGGGFWVVAVMGQECFWYNDIEDGFNVSRYEAVGRIHDYWCSQTELLPCIRGYFETFMRECGGGG